MSDKVSRISLVTSLLAFLVILALFYAFKPQDKIYYISGVTITPKGALQSVRVFFSPDESLDPSDKYYRDSGDNGVFNLQIRATENSDIYLYFTKSGIISGRTKVDLAKANKEGYLNLAYIQLALVPSSLQQNVAQIRAEPSIRVYDREQDCSYQDYLVKDIAFLENVSYQPTFSCPDATADYFYKGKIYTKQGFSLNQAGFFASINF